MHNYKKTLTNCFYFSHSTLSCQVSIAKLDVYVAFMSYFNVVNVLKLSKLMDGRIIMMFYFSSQESWAATLE